MGCVWLRINFSLLPLPTANVSLRDIARANPSEKSGAFYCEIDENEAVGTVSKNILTGIAFFASPNLKDLILNFKKVSVDFFLCLPLCFKSCVSKRHNAAAVL